jgi:hypothetical protein
MTSVGWVFVLNRVLNGYVPRFLRRNGRFLKIFSLIMDSKLQKEKKSQVLTGYYVMGLGPPRNAPSSVLLSLESCSKIALMIMKFRFKD